MAAASNRRRRAGVAEAAAARTRFSRLPAALCEPLREEAPPSQALPAAMPAGVPWPTYLKTLAASMLAMFAGAEVVHRYYRPDLVSARAVPVAGCVSETGRVAAGRRVACGRCVLERSPARLQKMISR